MASEDIGGMLRAARVELRLTVEEAARRAKTSKQHQSMVEVGAANPSIEMLRRMLDAVGLEIVVRKARAKVAG